MKTIVSVQEVSEFELKPPAELAHWHSLVDAEIERRWHERAGWRAVQWPTCNMGDEVPAFERNGFSYVESPVCLSLFASPRPTEEALWSWYRDSAPARYWREQLLPASKEARFENIARPRADWVLDGIAEYHPAARRLLDVSSNGRDVLDLVAAEATGLQTLVAAGMTADLEGASVGKVSVQPARIAELESLGPVDVIVAFDALDRAPDMGALIQAFDKALPFGGVLFGSVPVASGFEIQTLWDRSPSILPPDKLNLPSIEALQQIFAQPRWELLELSTPGMFDVELVRRTIASNPNAPWPRVVRALVERTDTAGRTALVELLQGRRLASFARFVARKVA